MTQAIMKYVRIAILAAMSLIAVSVYAADSALEARTKESLKKADTDREKMKFLGKLSDINFGLPAELVYLKQLYGLTSKNKANYSNTYKAMAISHICRYYFNINKLDSVIAWANKFDEVILMPDIYSRYFDTKYYQSSAYLEKGITEKALDDARGGQKDAERLQREDGKETGYELRGDV